MKLEKLTVSQCTNSSYCQGFNDAVEAAVVEYDVLYAKYKAVCAELEELQNKHDDLQDHNMQLQSMLQCNGQAEIKG